MLGGRALRWRTAVFWLVVFVIVLVVGAALFAVSGIYNVAASVPHLRITSALIEFALRRSVATHSIGVAVPDLSDKGLVRLGANHFRLGCAPCHGSPAGSNDPIVEEMYPAPPPLGQAVKTWDTGELFWIVRHGLKFTGMPAWSGEGRDDEVWALVAFLEQLPEMGESEFRQLAGPPVGGGALIDFGKRRLPELELCVSCHGDARTPPVSDLVPVLQGQTADYLHRSLDEYRHDKRQSGIMEPVAAALDDEMIAKAARSYAGMEAPPPAGEENGDPQAIRRGRIIAENGIPDEQLPPCLACHSGRASSRFPVLSGLSAGYIRGQLELFRKGGRNQTAYGAIMTTIAQRLTSGQIADVAAYFSSLPVGSVPPKREREIGRR